MLAIPCMCSSSQRPIKVSVFLLLLTVASILRQNVCPNHSPSVSVVAKRLRSEAFAADALSAAEKVGEGLLLVGAGKVLHRTAKGKHKNDGIVPISQFSESVAKDPLTK